MDDYLSTSLTVMEFLSFNREIILRHLYCNKCYAKVNEHLQSTLMMSY